MLTGLISGDIQNIKSDYHRNRLRKYCLIEGIIRQTSGKWLNGSMAQWLNGSMAQWLNGSIVNRQSAIGNEAASSATLH